MPETFSAYDIPRQPQRQDDLNQQLTELVAAAIRLGMYDAADWVTLQRRQVAAKRADQAIGGWPRV